MSVEVELILLEGQEEMCSFVRLIVTMGKLTPSIRSPTRVIWEY